MKTTTVGKGYGTAHTAQRKWWQAKLDRGEAIRCVCQRGDCPNHEQPTCPVIITASSAWDLGHTDDRTDWTGPECVPCNRSAGARNSRTSQTNPMTIRGWCQPQ